MIRYTDKYLEFANSWGTTWANKGFFRIENEATIPSLEYYDVFWTLDDLTFEEKQSFQSESEKWLKEKAKMFNYIFQNKPYKCPKCLEDLPINSFKGNLFEAECPKCNQKFKP